MRHRINVSITPACYNELQRISKDYGFVNLCEICAALLNIFIDRVNDAEGRKGNKVESNEELIKKMFAEFENWEPTPQPDLMYRRHQKRNYDDMQSPKHRTAYSENTTATEDQDGSAGDGEQDYIAESIYDQDYTERSNGSESDDDQDCTERSDDDLLYD